MSDSPRRAHSVRIEAGADTQADLIAVLKQIIFDVQHGSTGASSGSPSAGYFFDYEIDPSMTRERYFRDIEAIADRLMLVRREIEL